MTEEADDPELDAALEYLLRDAFLRKWNISGANRKRFAEAIDEASFRGGLARINAAAIGTDDYGAPSKLSRRDVVELRDAAKTIVRLLEDNALHHWLYQGELLGQRKGAPPKRPFAKLAGHPVETMTRLVWVAEHALLLDGRKIEGGLRKERETAQVSAASFVLWHFFRLLPGRTGAIAKKSSNQGGGYSAAVEFVTECVQNLFPDDERAREEATIYAVLKPEWDKRRKK